MQKILSKFISKITSLFLSFAMVLSMIGFSFGLVTPIASAATVCSTINLNSGTGTQTAGFTSTNPMSSSVSLLPATYSLGAFASASATQTNIPPWIDPATDVNYASTSAVWVSSAPFWPGNVSSTESISTSDQWRLFRDSFTLPAGAVVTSANLWYSADNAASVYLNASGTPISTTNVVTEGVFGPVPASNLTNYAQVFTTAFTPVAGSNTIDFVLRNWNASASTTNPTGLLYSATVNYCVTTPDPVAVVHVYKFIDGVQALASTTGSLAFPMISSSTAANLNGGAESVMSWNLDLANGYSTSTASMNTGANYALSEVLSGANVGASCSTTPYSLVGYSYGDTLGSAILASTTTSSPNLTGITSDKYVIVWNHDCASSTGGIGGDVTGGSNPEGSLFVTGVTVNQSTAIADGTYPNGWSYTFNITVPANEQNLSMRFADWFNATASSTIATANNMQISSLQADNGNAVVPITAANTYSSPALHMTGDLSTSTPGMQVQVLVQVKVPINSINGSYTTTYGIRTLP
jgi:hypothetical protein